MTDPEPAAISIAPCPPQRRPSLPESLGALRRRLINLRVADLLARNTLVSCATFLFDLLLLWSLVEWLGMGKLIAAALAFLVAVTIHYGFARSWIFKGSERALASGYAYFLINAVIGLVLTIASFAALMAVGLHYMVARVIASVIAGLAVFLLNATLNFRSV